MKFTKDQKEVGHFIYHFVKCFMIGAGEGYFLGEFAKRGKTTKSKVLRLAIGGTLLLSANHYVLSEIETKNLKDRIDEVDDTEKGD